MVSTYLKTQRNYINYTLIWWLSPVFLDTQKPEAGEMKVQGLLGLQNKIQASLNNFRAHSKIGLRTQSSGRVLN